MKQHTKPTSNVPAQTPPQPTTTLGRGLCIASIVTISAKTKSKEFSKKIGENRKLKTEMKSPSTYFFRHQTNNCLWNPPEAPKKKHHF
eukprot:m.142266 g.142266  ORF g.142266 m.142266 type:complete len:88 (-) comp30242_c2_seq1:26-289(-)